MTREWGHQYLSAQTYVSKLTAPMLRLWLTLYYGYWLFFIGFASVRGQAATPVFEFPHYVWWKGNAITFQKYRNDGSCLAVAVNSSTPNANTINGYADPNYDQQNGWFGGIDRVTFKMDGTSCIKLPTRKLGNPDNTWVQMWFQSGYNGCSAGMSSGSMVELRFFNTNECRQGQWQSVVNQWDIGGMINGEGQCFYDRGGASNPPQGQVYYRAFCDVAPPTTSHIYPSTTIVTNITTFVPSIVKTDDLVPLIQALMARNASLFKVFSTSLNPSAPSAPSPPSPTPTLINGAPNQKKQESSASDTEMFLTYVTLFGVFALAVSFC